MSRAHTAWLQALIQTMPEVATKTFVTTIPDQVKAVPPYVVIHPATGTNTAERESSGAFTRNPRWTIHTVGVTSEQAAKVGEKIGDLLVPPPMGVGITPTIAGERPNAVWWNSPAPVQVDKQVVPWVIFHIAECGFSSYPA